MKRPPLVVSVPAATALVVGCLAAPHPLRGDGGGVSDGRSGDSGSGSGSCTPIDPFTASPDPACNMPVSGQAGKLVVSSSGPTITCQWTLDSGLGSGVFVDLFALTATGSSTFDDTAYLSLGLPGTGPTLSVSHAAADPAHYAVLFSGASGPQLTSSPWLLIQVVDAGTISGEYGFDGRTWSELGRASFMPSNPTQVVLELQTTGGSGMGSAVFEDFERCP